MVQLRRILLSGLVALLMIGFVSADELTGTDDGSESSDSGIVLGAWVGNPASCQPADSLECITVILDFDLRWLLEFFK